MQYESSPAGLSPHFYKTSHTREQPCKCFVLAVLQTVCMSYWISEKSPWGEAPDITGKKQASYRTLTSLPRREAILG